MVAAKGLLLVLLLGLASGVPADPPLRADAVDACLERLARVREEMSADSRLRSLYRERFQLVGALCREGHMDDAADLLDEITSGDMPMGQGN